MKNNPLNILHALYDAQEPAPKVEVRPAEEVNKANLIPTETVDLDEGLPDIPHAAEIEEVLANLSPEEQQRIIDENLPLVQKFADALPGQTVPKTCRKCPQMPLCMMDNLAALLFG
jgi:hypothetical protein